MLHALAAEKSSHPVWWLYGARDREEHPFRDESRSLLQKLKYGRSYIQYSRPGPADQRGVDFDAAGHLAKAGNDPRAIAVCRQVIIGLLLAKRYGTNFTRLRQHDGGSPSSDCNESARDPLPRC